VNGTVLQATGLTKRYGQLMALDDLSLQVYNGEVFGLLGPNGAGKTTFINILCGLLKPNAGEVRLYGCPIDGSNRDLRARVGLCPQEVVVWDRLTCIEQLVFVGAMYGVKATLARQRGDVLLERLNLSEKRRQRAHKLSGGMKRRLNLALALVHDPDLVVLDEPEAGLDPQGRVLVREFIQELAQDKTVILTTHNMDEAERVADRVAIIDNGKLLVLDTLEALKRQVGEGDVAEISLPGNGEEGILVKRAMEGLPGLVGFDLAPGAVLVRSHHLANQLPEILTALRSVGVQPGDVRLRAITLEDVFIQLTGRRLRQ